MRYLELTQTLRAVMKDEIHSVFPPFKRGGPNFDNFKKGGTLKDGGWGKPKGGERFSKIKGGTQLFKLNSGVEKNKNKDF